MQSLVDRRVGHVADVGHLHVGNRTRQVGFLHRAVTDDHHLVDGVLGVGNQVDVDFRTVADDDLPGDIAQVGDRNQGVPGTERQRIAAVAVGDRAAAAVGRGDRGADHRRARFIQHRTRQGLTFPGCGGGSCRRLVDHDHLVLDRILDGAVEHLAQHLRHGRAVERSRDRTFEVQLPGVVHDRQPGLCLHLLEHVFERRFPEVLRDGLHLPPRRERQQHEQTRQKRPFQIGELLHLFKVLVVLKVFRDAGVTWPRDAPKDPAGGPRPERSDREPSGRCRATPGCSGGW